MARSRRSRERLSAAEARRVGLAAQGFADGRPARPDGRALRRVLRQVGLLQIDSVNVLARGHYLTLFGRLGAYPVDLVDRAAWYAPRRLFEYWGHEASLLPVEIQPLLRWRMKRAHDDAWGGMRRVATERPELVERVLATVAERGPIAASEVEEDDIAAQRAEPAAGARPPRRREPWWSWSDAKRAFEFLFWSGEITSARRRNFERLYDLPERVLPRRVLAAPTPTPEDAQRELVRIAARSLGVAAERDLRDYFRLPTADTRDRVAELVEAAELLPVDVEGWGVPAYLWHGTVVPRRVSARSLVGPFDSLLWERSRVERLFGFRYRIEIYVPAAKRVHGYYVLPFLLGDRLVGRVDLKADRAAGALRVRAAHAEPGAPGEAAAILAEELRRMADWLGLDQVRVERRGNLAPRLRSGLPA